MKPLGQVLSNDRFEDLHDFLSEICAGFTRAKCAAVIDNLWKNLHRVAICAARNADGQEGAAARAGEFRRSDRSREAMAEQLYRHGGSRGGAIDQQGYGGSSLQAADHLHEGKWIFPDDECFDSPARARILPQFCERCLRFGLGNDQEGNPAFAEERSAKLPVAQMRRQEKQAASTRSGSFKTFPLVGRDAQGAHRAAGFVAPEIGEFKPELTVYLSGSALRQASIKSKGRKQVFDYDFPTSFVGGAVRRRNAGGDSLKYRTREHRRRGQACAPQVSAV